MNASLKQDARMGAFSSVLGKDALVLLRMVMDEHVNDLFTVKVEALSQSHDIDFDVLIGTHATVTLKSFDQPDVPFDGIVTEATFAGLNENGWRYELTLRPWFWLAGRRRNQRIYHNKTVVEILDELLAPYSALGKPAVEKRLSENYPTLEYTVQYRESDLDFATRLMERFGISYHFEHSDGSHALVMTDAMTAHDPLSGKSRKFQITSEGHRADEEHFWDMRPTRRMTTGGIRLTDYNFKMPNAAMEVDRMGDAAYAEGQIESYDYPGDYLEAGRGKDVARLRTLQERGQDHRHRAIGDCTSLRAGFIVKVTGDDVHGVTDPCLCLSARHTYATASYASGQGSDEPTYEGSYVLIPTTAPLAPERKTDIPRVQGPQTAVVVGEGEIDCDDYGRILVHFHWDLDKRYSMRCRVSQNWASKGWGGMVIPRIGMEVVVEFLEGDPDKPLVTGCVFNGKNDVPYELPEHKTRSTFRTDTHKADGFNELRFEDEKNEEEIYIHAQRDLHTGVENDRRTSIGNDSHEQIAGNKTQLVRGENVSHTIALQAVTTSDTMVLASGNTASTRPVPHQAFTTGADDLRNTPHPRMNVTHGRSAEKGSMIVHSAADMMISSDGESHIQSDRALSLTSLDTLKLTTPANLKISSQDRVVMEASQGIVLASPSGIVLRSGASKITLAADGKINIEGTLVTIKGDKVCLN